MDTYEKKYNEALERAIKIKHDVQNIGCTMDVDMLDLIFPELRESEDERVRKCLIAMVNATIWDSSNIASKKACLAWLEKQKEQKPAECIEDSVKFEEGFKAGRESGLRDGQKYVLNNLDSYGLCKPAEWSEEDDKMVRFYEDDYNNNLGNVPMRDVIENRFKFKDWLLNRLKSLRPSWKPSEEQIYSLGTVVNGIGEATVGSIAYNLKELYEQLKKL